MYCAIIGVRRAASPAAPARARTASAALSTGVVSASNGSASFGRGVAHAPTIGRFRRRRDAPLPVVNRKPPHHTPVFGIEAQGSAGAFASPRWRSSIEMLSGERTNAMLPSRGGRLMVTPAAISLRQVA